MPQAQAYYRGEFGKYARCFGLVVPDWGQWDLRLWFGLSFVVAGGVANFRCCFY